MAGMIWIFLPGILLLGLVSSYTDIRYGKIRNKHIMWSFGYAALAYIVSFYFGLMDISMLGFVFSNLIFAVFAGFFIWYFGIWTAGDGKLFIAYALIIPLSSYRFGYEKYMPSFALLANIFIIAVLLMAILLLSKLRIKEAAQSLFEVVKQILSPLQVLFSMISIFAVLWVSDIFLSFLGIKSYPIRILFTMSAMIIVEEKLREKGLLIMIALSILRIVFDKSVYSFRFLYSFLFVLGVWMIIRSALRGALSKFAYKYFTKKIKTNDLRPGMVLSDAIQKRKGLSNIEKQALKSQSDTSIIEKDGYHLVKKPKSIADFDSFVDEESEGLTPYDIKKIRDSGFNEIKVSQTIPFAPLIFAGVLASILAKGNILIVLLNLF